MKGPRVIAPGALCLSERGYLAFGELAMAVAVAIVVAVM